MKMKFLYGLTAFAAINSLNAQDSLLQYVSVASSSNPTISASFSDPAVTPADLTAGSGLTAANGGSYNWNGWDTESLNYADAVAANDFYSWGFTAAADLTLSTLEIRFDRSGSGPDDVEIQATVNGNTPVSLFTHDFGDSDAGVFFSGIDLTGLGSITTGDVVVFTLAAFNSESTGGTFDIENEGGIGINVLGSSSIDSIVVEVDQSSYAEAFGLNGEITVRRTGSTDSALTVNLSADLASDVDIPASITIPIGANEEFDLFGPIDDSDIEATEIVTITASAGGFTDATTSFEIFDNDTPTLLVVNEFLADPPAGVDVNGDGSASTSEDEFIEFFNSSESQLDLSDWTIADGNSVRHTFPTGTFLEPGCAIVVTGGGTDVPTSVGTTQVQVASTGALGLNNGGDSITVEDASSTSIINLSYGSEAGSDESINLDPDFTDGSTYVLHSEVADAVGVHSFGTTVEGNDPCATEFLAVTFTASAISETDPNPATTGTVTRTGGDNLAALTVSLASNDESELTVPATVEIPATEDSVTFDITVVDDNHVDGDREVVVSASAPLVGAGSETITVEDSGDTFSPPTLVTINEIWADDAGTDNVEYIELFGTPGASLSGLSLIVVSGGNGFENTVPYSYEFTSETIPLDGFFLIAAGLDSDADVIAPANFIPNFAVTYAIVPTSDFYVDGESTLTAASQAALPNSVIDSIAVSDGAFPLVYFGAPEILPNPDGFPYDLVFRIADGAGSANADWMTQDHFPLNIEYGDSNDLLSTAGASNSMTVSTYEVTISDCSATGGQFVINFTATGSSDVYVSTDLSSWGLATNGGGVGTGTYTDTAPPAGRAFYLIQEAGTTAPGVPAP